MTRFREDFTVSPDAVVLLDPHAGAPVAPSLEGAADAMVFSVHFKDAVDGGFIDGKRTCCHLPNQVHAVDRILSQNRHRIIALEIRLLVDSERNFTIFNLIEHSGGEIDS